MNEIIIISVLFFLIALIYSSAGFGGGSSYLAILSMFSFSFIDFRMLALLCNMVVVSTSVFLFHRYSALNYKKILPLIIPSIPLAYLGGRYLHQEKFFFILLGGSLLLASVIMLLDKSKFTFTLPNYSIAFISGGIGFLSGMVGIGGGIFLSPILHISKWATPKVIASISALFILLNSMAGLIGQISRHGWQIEWKVIFPILLAVFFGGQIGVRLTIFRFDQITVRRITAMVILLVACRILWKSVF